MAKTFTADSITNELKSSGIVNIPGVGKLRVVHKEARVGRNPATGETIQIPAKKVVTFKMSSTLAEAVNGG